MARFLAGLIMILTITTVSVRVQASDPELTTDFFVPAGMNVSCIDSNYFTFTSFRAGSHADPKPGQITVTPAFSNVFTALTGLGVSTALLEFTPASINPPHTHPRGTEILFVLSGCLTVGFVDTTNKLFEQSLQTGDLFVFPKGLVHFQVNEDTYNNATALAAFSSSSPGVLVLPPNLFGSGIQSWILEQAFSVSSDVISQLEAPFKPVYTYDN